MSVGAAIGGAVVGAFAVAGCQTLDLDWTKKNGDEKPPAVSDPAGKRLEEAAIRAEEALAKLARTRSGNRTAPAEIPRHVAPELQRPVTLDLLGPLETVAKRLAQEAGYDFVVAGRRPAAPVMIELEVKDRALIFALNDAGMQAGEAALLTVDAGRMLVRLDWLEGEPAIGVRNGEGVPK